MKIKRLTLGPLATNCYIVSSSNECVVIDPGEEAERILRMIAKTKKLLKYIILTHYHFDHVLAAQELKKKTGAEILIHEKDADFLDFSADRYLKEGDRIKIGEDSSRSYPQPDSRSLAGSAETRNQNGHCQTFTIWHSPGHTKGSICLLTDKEIFVGDLIFEESYGRTDLKGGSEQEMRESLKKISKILKPGMIIYPGHGKIFTILSEAQVGKIGRAM